MSAIIFPSILALLGLFLGSFVGATVWRIRARQLRDDTKAGEHVRSHDAEEVSKLKKRSVFNDRSVCLHCGHQLAWYDLVPLFSWVYLNGRCRYCRKRIGNFEPLIEIGMAAFFVVSYLVWPAPLISSLDILQFVIWLAAGVGLFVLFVYDAKWFLLPNVVMWPVIAFGAISALLTIYNQGFEIAGIMSVVYACIILSGLYYFIYVLSKHQWVGFGDVKLGLALALLLADWRLALLTLFLANLIGTLIFLPLMVTKKLKRHAHIPFGPLLISAYFIAGLFGLKILNWYLFTTLGLS